MKFSNNDFFSKYDKIRSLLRICSHFLKKAFLCSQCLKALWAFLLLVHSRCSSNIQLREIYFGPFRMLQQHLHATYVLFQSCAEHSLQYCCFYKMFQKKVLYVFMLQLPIFEKEWKMICSPICDLLSFTEVLKLFRNFIWFLRNNLKHKELYELKLAIINH